MFRYRMIPIVFVTLWISTYVKAFSVETYTTEDEETRARLRVRATERASEGTPREATRPTEPEASSVDDWFQQSSLSPSEDTRLLARFKPGVSEEVRQATLKELGLSEKGYSAGSHGYLLSSSSGASHQALAEKLKSSGLVEMVEPLPFSMKSKTKSRKEEKVQTRKFILRKRERVPLDLKIHIKSGILSQLKRNLSFKKAERSLDSPYDYYHLGALKEGEIEIKVIVVNLLAAKREEKTQHQTMHVSILPAGRDSREVEIELLQGPPKSVALRVNDTLILRLKKGVDRDYEWP